MGTNYYLHFRTNVCEHCGRGDEQEPLHIGKYSFGWCFSLHVIPEDSINGLEDWQRLFATESSVIRDEYGETVTVEEMLRIITQGGRKGIPSNWEPYGSEDAFHAANHSKPGPNGLLRHRIDDRRCVGNGEGTWDYIVGEFS